MRLLIVDDEMLAAHALADNFDWGEKGFSEVIVRYDGDQAWEILSNGNVDLLLCDIEMPFMDGLHLQKRIVEHQLKTRTVLLTCHADFVYAQQALRLGVTDYLLKPIVENELNEVVDQAVIEIRANKMKNNEPRGMKSKILEKACDYIALHLGEEIGRDEVAGAVFLNPDYLNRIFKKELNVSISHYILEEKMKKAQELLRTTDYSVSTIGDMVGFSNFSAFSYAFKRSTGCSPTAFRKR